MRKRKRLCMLALMLCLCFLLVFPTKGDSIEEDIGVTPGHSQAYAMAVYDHYLLEILPDYGADAYLDGVTLVVCVTDEAHIAAIQEQLPKAALDENVLQFEIKKYSYTKLKEAQGFLNDYMPEYGISMTALNTKENCLKIILRDESRKEELLELLRQRGFEEGMFRFKIAAPVEPEDTFWQYEMKPEDYKINLNAAPRTYIILIGTAVTLITEYSIFGWLERRENARYRRR